VIAALAADPGVHPNGTPSRDRNDASYLRPLTNKRDPSIPR
jgi:hypothetical protein